MKLPSWAPSLRPHQLTAISKILAEFNAGRSIVMFDAPTGTGKTLIAECTRQLLSARALYLCHTLALQDQFLHDFPHAAILKGRPNYPILRQQTKHGAITANDCTRQGKTPCRWCDPESLCPYTVARRDALQSDLVCSNISYFLHEANYVGALPLRRTLIVVDEADVLEEEIMRFIEVRITERRAAEYGIELPSKKTVLASWIDWAIMAHQRVSDLAKQAARNQSDLAGVRRAKSLDRLRGNLARLLDPTHGLGSGAWIYTDYDRGAICFKPVRIDHLAHDYLWRHGVQWLLMSATMVSFQAMAADLGMNGVVSLPHQSSLPLSAPSTPTP